MKTINKNTCHYPAGLDNPEKGNSHFTRYSAQVRVGQNKKAFTLVELIIVITILAILATIAFISFQNYTKDARDGNRVSTINNLQKGLELYAVKTGKYPEPEGEVIEGIFNSELLNKVGYIKENTSRLINFSKTPTDPVSQDNYYVYGVSYDNKQYQIATTLENLQTSLIVPTTYANSYQAYINGNYTYPLKKGNTIYTLPSLIFTGTGNLALNSTGFVVNKGQNLPYKINSNTPNNSQTLNEVLKIVTNNSNIPTTSLTGITITSASDFKSRSGTLAETFFGTGTIQNIDKLGMARFGVDEYIKNIKDKEISNEDENNGDEGGGEPTPTYTITATAGSNGSVSCTPNPVNHGSDVTCTASHEPNYEVDTWTGCDSTSGNTCTLTNVTSNKTVSVSFKVIPQTGTVTTKDLTQTYTTQLMPDGKWWTTQNMKHGIMLANETTMPSKDNTIEKWCYDNDTTNCTNEGGLYTWAEAMGFPAICNTTDCTQVEDTTKSVCGALGDGWSLPTDDQWTTLTNAGATGWTGNKLSGIVSSLPGTRFTAGSFGIRGSFGFWWSGTQIDSAYSWYRYLTFGNTTVDRDIDNGTTGFSVVCIEN